MNTAAKAIAESHALQGRLSRVLWDSRQHSLGMFVLIFMVLASAFSVVYERNMYRATLTENQSLIQDGHELNLRAKQLELEQSAWATQSRIQNLAESTLGMQTPDHRHSAMVKL